jgi:hypothetical protein
MIMSGEVLGIRKKTLTVYLKALFRDTSGETEENYGKTEVRIADIRAKIRTGCLQKEVSSP